MIISGGYASIGIDNCISLPNLARLGDLSIPSWRGTLSKWGNASLSVEIRCCTYCYWGGWSKICSDILTP